MFREFHEYKFLIVTTEKRWHCSRHKVDRRKLEEACDAVRTKKVPEKLACEPVPCYRNMLVKI